MSSSLAGNTNLNEYDNVYHVAVVSISFLGIYSVTFLISARSLSSDVEITFGWQYAVGIHIAVKGFDNHFYLCYF